MGLLVTVEALHNEPSKNWYYFSEQELRSSVKTWTKDYNKPVLINHNTFGECVGRIVEAKFSKSTIKPDLYTHILTLDIIDPEAQQKVKDGRYKTVSMGCTTKAITCSICGVDILQEGWCGHTRGRKYKDKVCMWNIKGPEYDEISFVNRPADTIAQVIDILGTTEAKQSIERRDMMQKTEEKDVTFESEVEILDRVAQEESSDTPSESTTPSDEPEKEGEVEATEVEQAEDNSGETKEEDEVEALKQQLVEKDAQIEEMKGKVASLTEENEILRAENEALTLEKTELSNQLKSAKESNRDLVRATKSVLVEALGKIKCAVDGGEEAAVKKQISSLNMKGIVSQLNDVAESVRIAVNQRPVVQVASPAQIIAESESDSEGEKKDEVEEKAAKKTLTQKDLAKVLMDLFGGKLS